MSLRLARKRYLLYSHKVNAPSGVTMIDAVIKEAAIPRGQQAFSKQVTNQWPALPASCIAWSSLLSAEWGTQCMSELRYAWTAPATRPGKWRKAGCGVANFRDDYSGTSPCITRMTKQLALSGSGKQRAAGWIQCRSNAKNWLRF